MRSQTAVTPHFKSKQLLLFAFAVVRVDPSSWISQQPQSSEQHHKSLSSESVLAYFRLDVKIQSIPVGYAQVSPSKYNQMAVVSF